MTADGPDPRPAPRAPAPAVRPAVTRRLRTLGLLAACSLAGCSPAGPAGPHPEHPQEAGEAPFLDGSADGAGDPAGVQELVLGQPATVGELVLDAPAGAPVARSLEDEVRSQFAGLFLDPDRRLPPALEEQVAEYVGLFHEGRARENYRRWLAREGRYRDLILEELRAADLPDALLYLAMLESGFNPTAVSRAKAVGLWQFMRATGRASGLRIDDWVDERRDPVAATRAAVAHLRLLHDELGDWGLAAAAYNAGLGRVRRARRGSDADYFDLVADGRLPRETANYIPLILAAGHVARHRQRYGFGDVPPDPPLAYLTVRVEGRTRLSAVARATGTPVDELEALNPHLLRGAAPPGSGYPLRIPVGTSVTDLPERLASLPLEARILPEYREVHVTVEGGDSWWRIARRHGRTVSQIRALNPKLGDVIHPGQRILVERRIVTDSQLSAAPASALERYRVRRGDTMYDLARRFGVSVEQLATWNDMTAPRPLREGEVLRVADGDQ